TPAGDTSAHRWWRDNAVDTGSWAGTVLADLMDEAAYVGRRAETLLAVALRPPRGGLRRLSDPDVRTREQELGAIADALAGADIDITGWVSVAEVHAVLRTAYDPTARPVPDHVPSSAATPAMGVAESWTHVATDGGVHTTYWIAEWPRSDVHPGFLQ